MYPVLQLSCANIFLTHQIVFLVFVGHISLSIIDISFVCLAVECQSRPIPPTLVPFLWLKMESSNKDWLCLWLNTKVHLFHIPGIESFLWIAITPHPLPPPHHTPNHQTASKYKQLLFLVHSSLCQLGDSFIIESLLPCNSFAPLQHAPFDCQHWRRYTAF